MRNIRGLVFENFVQNIFLWRENTKEDVGNVEMSSLKVLSFGFVTYRFEFEYFSDS